MTDPAYVRVTALDDPDKPHRSVWRTPTGVHVKLHVRRLERGLGQITYEIVPSACDESGKALRRADGSVSFLSLDTSAQTWRDLLKVLPDAAEIEPISTLLHRRMMFAVARVERAVLLEREADAPA